MLTDVRIVGFEWDRGNRSNVGSTAFPLRRSRLFCFRRRVRSRSPMSGIRAANRGLSPSAGPRLGRGVFTVFTLRRHGEETFIRPVSARYMHRKEVEYYEKEISRSQNR